MRSIIRFASVAVCTIVFVTQIGFAQEAVPSVVQFNGFIENARPGVKSGTFALYRDQRGEAPLWQETQNITVDAQGHFAVLLGGATNLGLPVDLFAKGEPRWLGFKVNDAEGEQPRVLLGSVPYALKAADANTLGGKPLSQFVLTTDSDVVAAKNVACTNPCINSFEIEDGAIVNADISASAGIAPTKIAGIAATLGPNTFSGPQTITSGNLNLPSTTSPASGVLTLGRNPFLHSSGVNNTFVGQKAGNFTMIGVENMAIGLSALSSNTSGAGNTASGQLALLSNTTGDGNTASGLQALSSNTTGSDNTALGLFALNFNTTGSSNTAVGLMTLEFNSTGSSNTASGFRALWNSTGDNNTALGYKAGVTANDFNANTTGSNNTFIGHSAGPGTTTQLVNATAIGANALVSASNALVLGNSSVSVGIGTQAPLTKLQVMGDIRVGTSGTNGCIQGFGGASIAGTCSSDERLKQNIEPFAPVLDKVIRLQPVTYEWRADEHPEYHFGPDRTNGLIAQEVEKVFPNMVSTDERGYKAVNYSQLPLLVLQAMKEQQAQIGDQHAQIQEQQAQIQELLSAVKALNKRLEDGGK